MKTHKDICYNCKESKWGLLNNVLYEHGFLVCSAFGMFNVACSNYAMRKLFPLEKQSSDFWIACNNCKIKTDCENDANKALKLKEKIDKLDIDDAILEQYQLRNRLISKEIYLCTFPIDHIDDNNEVCPYYLEHKMIFEENKCQKETKS